MWLFWGIEHSFMVNHAKQQLECSWIGVVVGVGLNITFIAYMLCNILGCYPVVYLRI